MGSVAVLSPSPRSGISTGFVRRVFDTLQRPKRQCRVYCDDPESDQTTLPGVVQMLARVHASIAVSAGSGTDEVHLLQHQIDDVAALMDVCRCIRSAICELQQYAVSIQQAASILSAKRVTRAARFHTRRALTSLSAVTVAAADGVQNTSSILRRVEEHCRRSSSSNNPEESTALRNALKASVTVLRQLLPSYNASGRSSADAKTYLSELHSAVQLSVRELFCSLQEVPECPTNSDADVARFADVANQKAEKLEECMRNLASHVNDLCCALRNIRVALLE